MSKVLIRGIKVLSVRCQECMILQNFLREVLDVAPILPPKMCVFGIITREEGFELAKEYDLDEPEVLQYFLDCTGYTKEEFYDIMIQMREGKAKELPGKSFHR